MPRSLGRLGIPETECERHIAWDIGIAAVCRFVAGALDATVVQQNYSRLVIDCNRAPGSETSIPEISELTPILGNARLSEGRKAARARRFSGPTMIGSKRRVSPSGRSSFTSRPLEGSRRASWVTAAEVRSPFAMQRPAPPARGPPRDSGCRPSMSGSGWWRRAPWSSHR
jgi:hypothetical protein